MMTSLPSLPDCPKSFSTESKTWPGEAASGKKRPGKAETERRKDGSANDAVG